MNTNPAIMLRSAESVIYWNDGSLMHWTGSDSLKRIIEDIDQIQYLCGSPDDNHFAFWSRRYEKFYLMDIDGDLVWSLRIDTDKAEAHHIQFSESGDSVAFIHDYDGAYFLHLFNLKDGQETVFGPSIEPVGYDSILNYFVISPVKMLTYDPFKVMQKEAGTAGLAHNIVVNRLNESIRIIVSPYSNWRWMMIESEEDIIKGIIFLQESALMWGDIDHFQNKTWRFEGTDVLDNRECFELVVDYCLDFNVINNSIPENDTFKFSDCIMTVRGDSALINIKNCKYAILVNKELGKVWERSNIVSLEIDNSYLVYKFLNGRVGVISLNGKPVLYPPLPESANTIAFKIINDTLYLADMNEDNNINIREFRIDDSPDEKIPEFRLEDLLNEYGGT